MSSLETFALDVTFRIGFRQTTASGRIGGRAVELELDRPLIKGPKVQGTFGDQHLELTSSGRQANREFNGTLGQREVDLLLVRDRRRFDVRGVIGDVPIRLRLRKRVLGSFSLAASHNGDGNKIDFDPSGLVDLTGRVVHPEVGLAAAILVEPMIKAYKSAFH